MHSAGDAEHDDDDDDDDDDVYGAVMASVTVHPVHLTNAPTRCHAQHSHQPYRVWLHPATSTTAIYYLRHIVAGYCFHRSLLACLSVCLSVSSIAQKVVGGFCGICGLIWMGLIMVLVIHISPPNNTG